MFIPFYLQCSAYGESATTFSSDFQIPHVKVMPVAYTLPNSDNEEEADREVGSEEEAEGDMPESESGTLHTGSSV
jgi:hypothetical protein